jgi:hypothetical protein
LICWGGESITLLKQLLDLLDQAKWRWTLLSVLMVLPALASVVASRLGPGMSPDSVNYASAARSFAESGDLTAYGG